MSAPPQVAPASAAPAFPPSSARRPVTQPVRVEVERSRRFGGGAGRHLLLGAMMTAVLYAVLFVPVWTKAGDPYLPKLSDRGWTPYASVFLSAWAVSILTGKLFTLRRRQKVLRDMAVPDDARVDDDESLERAIMKVKSETLRLKDSVLGRRIIHILEHLRISSDSKQLLEVMREDSENDHDELQASYTLVRVFLWTIPILGFIGTVIGVGNAVGGFAKFLSAAQEIDQIKGALTGVTTGLGVAFDTTFVALVLSVVLMIFMSGVERMEEGTLNANDDFCQRHFVALLQRAKSAESAEAVPIGQVVLEMADRAREFNEAAEEVFARLAEAIAAGAQAQQNMAGTVEALAGETRAALTRQEAAIKTAFDELRSLQSIASTLVDDVGTFVQENRATFSETLKQDSELLRAHTEALRKTAEDHGTKLDAVSRQMAQGVEHLGRQVGRLCDDDNGSGLPALLTALRSSLDDLRPAVRRLTDQPIDVDIHFVASSRPPAGDKPRA